MFNIYQNHSRTHTHTHYEIISYLLSPSSGQRADDRNGSTDDVICQQIDLAQLKALFQRLCAVHCGTETDLSHSLHLP